MLPSLQIGPVALPTYPLLLIAGLYVGLWLAAKVAARRGLNPDHLYNVGFYAFVAALVAGRLAHIIRYFPAYRSDPLSVFSPNLEAMQLIAALVAALLVFIWYQRKYQISVLPLIDSVAVGSLATLTVLALAQALNGLNFGAPSALPWAITQWSVARHPVQLYEMLGTLLVILLIWRYLDRLRPGEAALAAIGGYAVVRLVVDAFRDQPATIGDGFRLTQVIGLVAVLVVLLAFYQMRNSETAGEQDNGSIVLRWEQEDIGE